MRCVTYTDSLSSMLAIKNNRENHPILNQIYDTLTELHNIKRPPRFAFILKIDPSFFIQFTLVIGFFWQKHVTLFTVEILL